MHRFFVEKEQIKGENVIITGSELKHISHALRLEPGDRIIIVPRENEQNIEYEVELKEFSREEITAEIREKRQVSNEPPVNIHLAQAIPKNKNMELVAEKTTELGVKKIIPLTTERTVVKLSEKKAQKRVARWQRIVTAAAKQSQRGILPQIAELQDLQEVEKITGKYDLVLFFWTGEQKKSLHYVLQDIRNNKQNNVENILVLIGPEGGFSPREAELFTGNDNVYPVSLGPRILRTETAGLTVISILMYEFGGFNIC